MGKDTDELFSELTKAKTNILTPLPVWNNYLQNTN